MDAKTTLALFATAIFFQPSHCVPTHRLVRRAQEFVPYESRSEIASDGQASELQSSVAAREGGTPSSAVPSSYTNYMPSQFNPSQLSSQYPSQFPSQFNPSNYASSGAAAPAAAPAGAASEPQPSVAAREGGTPSSAVPSSYTNYMPSQFNPSQFNPSQLSSQYPSQFPSQFNPSNYASSGAAAPAAAPAAGSSGAASEPQPSVAAREGGTPSSAVPSSYQNYMPSQFNPSQLSGQYPSQFPSQLSGQFPSQFNPSNIASPSAAVPA